MNKYKYETREQVMLEINDMAENGIVYRDDVEEILLATKEPKEKCEEMYREAVKKEPVAEFPSVWKEPKESKCECKLGFKAGEIWEPCAYCKNKAKPQKIEPLEKIWFYSINPLTKRETFVAEALERHHDKIQEIINLLNNK